MDGLKELEREWNAVNEALEALEERWAAVVAGEDEGLTREAYGERDRELVAQRREIERQARALKEAR